MTEWFDRAACVGAGNDVFFPEIPTGDVRRIHWSAAKKYCDECPVTLQCLQYAMLFEAKTGRREGYWGNMTPKERDQHARIDRPLRWRQ